MSFLSKFLHKPKKGSSNKSNKEENKMNLHRDKISKTTGKNRSPQTSHRDLAMSKGNLCAVYNRNENFQSLNPFGVQPMNCQQASEKNSLRFKQALEEDIANLETLRNLTWQGVPVEHRPLVWKILLNYVPLNKNSRESTISRKREEYKSFVQKYFVELNDSFDETEKKAMKLIKDDVHRTQPDYPIFHHQKLQDMMTRILWIWHVRHPASGYVQGMNDLITPFIATFLSEYISNLDPANFKIPSSFEEDCTDEIISQIEADTFWCLCKILDGILDNYTFSQSGTQKALDKIREITKKIDPALFAHFQKRGVDFSFFSFRWIFCLLVREFPLKVGMRLFDTYISDEQGFSILHAYICSALLLKWAVKLKKMNFTDIMLFLQNMPTKQWSEEDIEIIIAEAYVFRTLYEGTFPSLTPSLSQNSN